MKIKSLKNKILFKLFRLLPGAERRSLLKQYIKVRENAPALAQDVWELLCQNWHWQKKNRNNCRIVSLGCDCMVRTFTTVWMLKPGKRSGEKSLPFDLAVTPPEMILHFLKNDFEDYFTDSWSYDPDNAWWQNAPGTGIVYPHDKDCGPQDLEKIQSRLKQRIENFRKVIDFPGTLFFIVHKTCSSQAETLVSLQEQISEMRRGKPFKMLVIASDHEENCRKIDGIQYVYLPYPRADYIWHDPEMRYTSGGMAYEMQVAEICREFVTTGNQNE